MSEDLQYVTEFQRDGDWVKFIFTAPPNVIITVEYEGHDGADVAGTCICCLDAMFYEAVAALGRGEGVNASVLQGEITVDDILGTESES